MHGFVPVEAMGPLWVPSLWLRPLAFDRVSGWPVVGEQAGCPTSLKICLSPVPPARGLQVCAVTPSNFYTGPGDSRPRARKTSKHVTGRALSSLTCLPESCGLFPQLEKTGSSPASQRHSGDQDRDEAGRRD